MRLINTQTRLLEDFIGDAIPEYAILSHTWEKDEISLQEFQRLTDPDFANDPKTSAGKAKAGFIKIQRCIELAASRGIPYVWVDTCCIDKTSSADLTESINSMYRWYANSKVCFAYLVDVEEPHHWSWTKSRWFTRGWTLQELVAPRAVEFYLRSWVLMDTKKDLHYDLSHLTGIGGSVMQLNDLSSASVAQKMSWASSRQTTRKEDMAYCLLGLFDINMPLLYGEGEKAFLRLQEHIAASSTDHSLFAWGIHGGNADETGDKRRSYRSIFARSPADFSECGKLVEEMEEPIFHPDVWTLTNRGFHAVLPTIPATVAKELSGASGGLPAYIDDTDYLVILNCGLSGWIHDYYWNHVVGMWICLTNARDDGKHGFCRVTDLATLLPQGKVSKLINSSPDKFRKNLWLTTTSRTIHISRDHFSKRLGGFLIPPPRNVGSFKVCSLYRRDVSGELDVLSCPLLPLQISGGLVGVLTIDHNSSDYHGVIIFGYPPGKARPVAKIAGYWNWNKQGTDEALLEYASRQFANAFSTGFSPDGTVYSIDLLLDAGKTWPENNMLSARLSLYTVLHENMIFTRLDISR